MAKRLRMSLGLLCVALTACESSVVREPPETTTAKIKDSQAKQDATQMAYLNCLTDYLKKYFAVAAGPSDIADAAAAACSSIADKYGMYRRSVEINTDYLNRRQYSVSELASMERGQSDYGARYAALIASDQRGASIDFVIKLRDHRSKQ